MTRIADRIARLVAVLASLIDPSAVIIGGAVADAVDLLLPDIETRVQEYTEQPPVIAASPLGDRGVTVGAIRLALNDVESSALDPATDLAHRVDPSHL